MAVLRALNLSKSYKKRPVIRDVSLSVESGAIVGLLGPNGAGKTTCFYMIVGLITQDGGEVFIGEENITNLPMHGRAKKGIGYLPQEASIFRKMSVENNILAILETRDDLDDTQRRNKTNELLEEFHLTHIRNSVGLSLSGGERRRVEIARSLATEPNFILLDEPFAGIDPIAVIDIQKIIKQLASNGIGILITDHSVRETLGICDQAYIVNQGEIFAKGTPKIIAQNQSVKDIYLGENFIL